MKNILAILGSPRALGNCEIMAKEISRQVDTTHRLQLLRLTDFNIQPCSGCYTCLIKNKCVIKDDYHLVAKAILEADALIVVAPTYFLGPHSCLKRFTDRGLALFSHMEELYNKPAVAVGVAGIKGKEGAVLLGVENFLKMLVANIKGRSVVYGALPGEIFLTDQNKKIARKIAETLFGPPASPPLHACSLCGGETFRFLGGDKVRCMLCSNKGTVTLGGDLPVFNMQRSSHKILSTLEDTLKHRDWLIEMKSRFKTHKEQLKKISSEYQNDGDWIIP